MSAGRSDEGRAPLRIMVVDDHPIWREAVARDLADEGFDVVATADGVGSAGRRAAAVTPDVVLMDMQLTDGTGTEATTAVLEVSPKTRILVLSASGERDDVLEAVKAGASGYLVKSSSREELVDAVRATADDAVRRFPWFRDLRPTWWLARGVVAGWVVGGVPCP